MSFKRVNVQVMRRPEIAVY